MLSGVSAHTTGAPGFVASMGSTTDGSTSYSITIASAAVCAATRDVATTAATGSPAKRTISCASRRRGGTVIGDQIGAAVDGFDAGHLGGGLDVDRYDLRMRMRRAQYMEP